MQPVKRGQDRQRERERGGGAAIIIIILLIYKSKQTHKHDKASHARQLSSTTAQLNLHIKHARLVSRPSTAR